MERIAQARLPLRKFILTPNRIEILEYEMAAQGGERKLRLESISVTTEHSWLTYGSVKELRADRVWEKQIKQFKLSFREVGEDERKGPRSIDIGGGTEASNEILVWGEDEGWVVGTVGIIRDVMQKYETWYSCLATGVLVRVVYPVSITITATLVILTQWVLQGPNEPGDVRWSFLLILGATLETGVRGELKEAAQLC